MDVTDAVVIVTGAGSGIGTALCREFAAAGAAAVIGADINADAVATVIGDLAPPVDAVAEQLDVTDAAAIEDLVARTVARFGRIDVFCSNAGILTGVELTDPDDLWHRAFEINTMAHVYAARAVLPSMLERGRGYLVNTASAAGLLTSPGDAPYAVTKHAAVAFAEWLSVTYGDRGITVSVVCPLGVATPMLLEPLAAGNPGAAAAVAASGEIITAEQVAQAVLAGVAEDRFLILPQPQVGTFWAQKASDPQRWLAGVRRLISRSSQA